MSDKRDIKELFDKYNAHDRTITEQTALLQSIDKSLTSFEKKFSHHDEKEMAKYDSYDRNNQELNTSLQKLTIELETHTKKVEEVIDKYEKTNNIIKNNKSDADEKIDKLKNEMITGFGEIEKNIASIWGKIKAVTLAATVATILAGAMWQIYTWQDAKYERKLAEVKSDSKYSKQEQKEYYQMRLEQLNRK